MMKLAVIYDDGEVLVQFDEQTFKDLLKSYLSKTGDIDSAFNMVIHDLKEKTRYA